MKILTLSLLCWGLAVRSTAAAEPIRLENGRGATIEFNETDGRWQLARLNTPRGPAGGLTIDDRPVEVVTEKGGEWLSAGWGLGEVSENRVVLEQAANEAGLRVRRVVMFGPASNVVRLETWARSVEGEVQVAQIGLLDLRVDGENFRETGVAPASFPLFGDGLFAGIEHVSGESRAAGDEIQLAQRPRLAIDETWRLVAATVLGWPLPGAEQGLPEGSAMRVAFLHYLDSVRIKPERMVLHSETWWTLPPPLHEKDVLADIEALKRGFLDRTGMFFDTYCLDLGWSDPRTFWRIADRRFPNEFRVVNERLTGLGARLGLWMSPGSGYPDGLNNEWLQTQGYEMTPFPSLGQAPCFALGTRYQREFKERLVDYARQYGLGHVILDFMVQQCDVASHGHPTGTESRYAIAAGVADVLDALRAVNPNIALEPMICGYPPSPWWLMKTPFVLGPAGDDVPYGRVASPEWMEALITARDIAYRAGQEAWLMPTQSLETWDIVVQTPGEFENTAVMAIGRGRWFLSSYIKPSLMKPEDWDFFAALVRWARANKEYLGNAWMIGGKPEEREAYGYMFRNDAKDLFCVRNPWIEERAIELPASAATEPRELRMIYPRRATLARVEPGQRPPVLKLAAYETVFLETVSAGEMTEVTVLSAAHEARVAAGSPLVIRTVDPSPVGEPLGLRYTWSALLEVPDIEATELAVLVAGEAAVDRAGCEILVGGQLVKATRASSAGQFGAATEASPDNWVWFIAPLPKGRTTLHVDIRVPTEEAAVGVYLRGLSPAHNDPAQASGPEFPVFRPERRAWSQTVMPLQSLESLARKTKTAAARPP